MSTSNLTVSFIIPAYNVEDTISQCIESIVKDAVCAHIDYEVIIIENGSRDHTYDKAKELCHRYENVKLITSKKGVSCARNAGIKVATGDKLIFVDADDCWVYGSLQSVFFQLRKQDVDLLICSYYKTGRKVVNDFQYLGQVMTGAGLIECRAWMLSRPNRRMTVWAKIFDKNVIEDNHIIFNESLSFSEDSEFLYRYARSCKNICVTNIYVYEYCYRSDSAMRSSNEKRISGYKHSLEITRKMIDSEPAEIKQAFWEYVLIHFNLICVHDIFDIEIRASFFVRMKRMKALRTNKIFAEALSLIQIRKCMTLQLLPELFIKCHISIFGGVICYVRSVLNHRRGASA